MAKLVTQAEFARICGVNRSTVTRWLQNGRIEANEQGLIDPESAARMRDATESPMPHHQSRKAQFDAQKQAVAAFLAQGGDTDTDYAKKSPQRPENPAVAPATPNATPPQRQEAMPAAEKIGTALKLETYKLQKAKAERENMELDVRAGALVERSEVDYVLADIGNTIRATLENLPDRLSSPIAAARGDVAAIHKTLEDGIRTTLGEIAEAIKRKTERMT